MAPRGRPAPMALVGVAGGALAAIGVGLHIHAGDGLPSDAARALSVQLPITAIGLLLAVHRPHNRLGPLALTAAALLGLSLAAVGVLREADAFGGVPVALSHLAFACVLLLGFPLTVVWLLALLAFPEGTPPPARARPWVAAAVGTHATVAVGAYVTAAPDDLPGYLQALDVPVGGGPFAAAVVAHDVFAALNNVFLLALPACGVAALVALRRHAGPVPRQQLRWLLPALGLQLAVHLAVPTSADPWHDWRAAGELAVLAAPAIGAVAIAVAVFKYRLWEIDAVISKALVFALLSAVVTAVFVVAGFGAAFLVGGANGQVLTALTVVLAAVVVSQGPRRRAEMAVRRLVYGDRPQGYAVLGGLADSLASAEGATEAADRIVDAVRRGLSVPWAAVWLYVEIDDRRSLRPLSSGGIDIDALELPDGAARQLAADPRAGPVPSHTTAAWSALASLVGDGTAAAPLVAGSELVGLIACGDRFRDPLDSGDYELLGLLARDAALGLVNKRLETELLFRLEELARSRQRLVAAQDGERRRVERDLHDGAQAQLVTLAIRLRQVAARPLDATSAHLTALATEAEEALFALQDLARGIYPSVLTDQGLPAALRAQAARMPVDVVVRTEPELASNRLPPETEAALYFVALEALGNAGKHAGGAHVCADLRLDAGSAVLEVTDDGPGFDVAAAGRSGQGLENMNDRVTAIGGRFTLHSEPGRGSCVSAVVPLPAGWLAAAPPVDTPDPQWPATDSRR